MKRVNPAAVALIPAAKPVKVPAVEAKREWRDFDAFVRLAGELIRIADLGLAGDPMTQAAEIWRAKNLLANWETVERMYRRYDKAREFYEREELYEMTKQPQQNLVGTHTRYQLTRRVVSEQVAMLIGSFPNSTPHSPEMYTRMLVEEIVTANPSATALEATCRQIKRTMKFVPTIAELLVMLFDQQMICDNRSDVGEDDIAYWREQLAKRVAQAKPSAATTEED